MTADGRRSKSGRRPTERQICVSPRIVLAEDPAITGGRQVVFRPSDDESTTATVAALVERLGCAPVSLGKIAEGGQLVLARDKSWAH